MQIFNLPNITRLKIKLDKTKVYSIFFAIFFSLSAVVLFYPIKEIFQGSAKLEQQFGIPLPGYMSLISNVFGQVIYIRFYAICILIGVLSGYILTLQLAKIHKIAGTVIDRLLLGLTVFGLIGARIFYVIFNFDAFLPDPLSIFFVWLGGLAIFGAIIASIIYLYIYCSRFKFNFFEFLDMITPGLLLGQIFGRFGNFFNYESYGAPTSVYWKMFIPQTAKITENIVQDYFHPTFLYEIIPNIFSLILILWIYRNLTAKRSGLVFGVYCISYGIIRFCTEFYRLDALKISLPFQIDIFGIGIQSILVSQISALILFIVGIGIIQIRKTVFSPSIDSFK